MKEIIIDEQNANQRLDKWLLKYLNKAPKSFVYKMIRKKNIKLNEKRATGNELLQKGDHIALYFKEETIEIFQEEKFVPQIDHYQFSVVYEDAHLLVVDKATNLLCHPEAATDQQTLIQQLLSYLKAQGTFDTSKSATFTPALCNRIDRNTSGLVLCGKDLPTVQTLSRLLSTRQVEKYYLALVKGRLEKEQLLEGFHQKDGTQNKVTISKDSLADGKAVKTHIKPLEIFDHTTLVEVQLITGKSHQIRAHLQSIGHPIIGDIKYGDADCNTYYKKHFGIRRQLLHAYRMVLQGDLDGLAYLEGHVFQTTMPTDFIRFLTKMQK